ncbi:DUF4380 domain-containing protein [Cytophaga aurantiaca]|uniref:DUF4380 domain-containing protein n=1 Tax=Cytophaga aurantiaca TaxID=29530 RepID=UPI0003648F06|nr:DUF4380 domain-containing protein [Cytophaga aurantiaca]
MKMNYLLPSLLIAVNALYSCADSKKTETAEHVEQTAKIEAIGDSAYTLSFAGLQAIVDVKNGGRLEALALNGENCLSGKKVNAGNWGTSLWPSPQEAWGWPPSQQLDNLAYSVLSDSSEVVLKSQKDIKQAFVFTKSYKIDTKDTSLVVTYTILNDTTVAQKVAAWEISRVAPNGLTFYPSGDEVKRGDLVSLTKDSSGVTWFQYDSTTVPKNGVPKLLADGKEGWLAQVNNGLLLVKSFEDVVTGKYAPKEGEIEFYTNPDKSYIEIEQQGTYVELQPGGQIVYVVRYKLAKLPSSVHVTIGDVDLLKIARSMKR